MRVRDIVAALGVVFMCAISLPAGAQTPAAIAPAKPAPAALAPAANDIPAPIYILGAQDVIQVDALGRSDFSTKARIGADGTVQLPFLGAFPAADRSVVQLRDDIAAALLKGGFFAKPIIQVEVISFASRYVTVLGAVGITGPDPGGAPLPAIGNSCPGGWCTGKWRRPRHFAIGQGPRTDPDGERSGDRR